MMALSDLCASGSEEESGHMMLETVFNDQLIEASSLKG